jgi:hypothetical protein
MILLVNPTRNNTLESCSLVELVTMYWSCELFFFFPIENRKVLQARIFLILNLNRREKLNYIKMLSNTMWITTYLPKVYGRDWLMWNHSHITSKLQKQDKWVAVGNGVLFFFCILLVASMLWTSIAGIIYISNKLDETAIDFNQIGMCLICSFAKKINLGISEMILKAYSMIKFMTAAWIKLNLKVMLTS